MSETISAPAMAQLLDRGASYMETGSDMHFSNIVAGPEAFLPTHPDNLMRLQLGLRVRPDGRQLIDLYALADRLGGPELATKTATHTQPPYGETRFPMYEANFTTADGIAVNLATIDGDYEGEGASTAESITIVRSLADWCRNKPTIPGGISSVAAHLDRQVECEIIVPSTNPLRDAYHSPPPFRRSTWQYEQDDEMELVMLEASVGSAAWSLYFISHRAE